MMTPCDRPRVGAEAFERLYEAHSDPWAYHTSTYEREKWADTLAALPPRRLGAVLEVGCSIGILSAQLATRCDRLVAIDFSPRAIEMARANLSQTTNVELLVASFPEQEPAGEWDVIVCSEVLYYLDRPTFELAVRRLRDQLERGGSVLAVSWRGEGTVEPLLGDEVHDELTRELASWHTLDGRRLGYRIDRFDGHAG